MIFFLFKFVIKVNHDLVFHIHFPRSLTEIYYTKFAKYSKNSLVTDSVSLMSKEQLGHVVLPYAHRCI